jgi:hypothetical protein
MRINRQRPQGSVQGSVLVISLVTMAILGITLGSYLQLIANQNISVARSMAWNNAVAVAEGGIEEAMAHLNKNTTNRITDGWTLLQGNNGGGNYIGGVVNIIGGVLGTPYAKRTRDLGDSKYKVMVSRDVHPPLIYAEGHVRHPITQEYLPVPRVIKVQTKVDPIFGKGMVAKGNINLQGNNIRTDSFDSSNTNYSTGGRYDASKALANGDIATNSSLTNSFLAGNANIFGRVSTGPGGSVTIGNQGGVGDAAWHAAGNNTIQNGYFTDDMNVQFLDVEAQSTAGRWPVTQGVAAGTNTYVVGTGHYTMPFLTMAASQSLRVTGAATLYIPGNVSITGSAYIYIEPGATLKLFVGGATAILGGSGVLNRDGKATAFQYWGLPSNTAVTMSGNAAFIGTIYAPQAALTLGGGGNTNFDFSGASVSNSVLMQGNFNFHYDEGLRNGPPRGYIVDSWEEVSASEVYISAGI